MTDPIPNDAMSTEPQRGKGLRGLLQRRAEAMLRKPGRALATLSEPGDCRVVLQLIGPRPIQVIATIKQASGLDLVACRALMNDAPAVVVSGISEASANRVVERLEGAGAKAVAGAAYRPE